MPGSMDGLRLAAAIRDRWPPIKSFQQFDTFNSGQWPFGRALLPEAKVGRGGIGSGPVCHRRFGRTYNPIIGRQKRTTLVG